MSPSHLSTPTRALPRVAGALGALIATVLLAVGGVPWTAADQRSVGSDVAVATVRHVVDGDTITVELGASTETIRLLGIDTPEKSGGPRPAECGGAEASTRTAELLPPGTQITLQRDAESRDQYGRVLAYVMRQADGLFVNETLIDEGHATATFYEPNTTWRTTFTRAELLARRDGRGFWGSCGGPSVLLAIE